MITTVIQVCDIVAAISIIVALNMVIRNYKWWVFYAATNIVFGVVTICKGLPGLTIMGIILGVTGVKNYLVERKKEKSRLEKGDYDATKDSIS